MTVEQALIGLIGLFCTVLGWFARELYTAVNNLKGDIQRLEVLLGTDYVRYDRLQDRLREAMEPVMKALDEIKQAMHTKVDKKP